MTRQMIIDLAVYFCLAAVVLLIAQRALRAEAQDVARRLRASARDERRGRIEAEPHSSAGSNLTAQEQHPGGTLQPGPS